MYGRVRCARNVCGATRERKDWTCPKCGYVKSFVDIKHRGRRYRIKDGSTMFTSIEKAHDILAEIRLAYNDDALNPLDYTEQGKRERVLSWQIDLWLRQKKEEVGAGELSPETLKDYRGYAKNHFTLIESFDVRSIGYTVLENFKDALPRKLKIKTRRNIMNALHSVFRRMHRKGVIREMPAFPVIEGNDSEDRAALTFDQQIDGLSRIPAGDRDVIELGFEMLLRPGETCALQIRDIDQLHRRMRVCRTWSGKHLRETTKGRNKVWIALTSRAWEIIAPRLAEKAPDSPVFINPRTGRAYRPKVLNRLWRDFSGYDLDHYSASRHSGCTQLVHNGTPLAEVQALMRHADTRSTLNYFHPDSDRLRSRLESRRESTLRALSKKKKSK
jgi:integrase